MKCSCITKVLQLSGTFFCEENERKEFHRNIFYCHLRKRRSHTVANKLKEMGINSVDLFS